uniref:Uncharacterized protein n=1 Tax=Triticum urartu TaxID=4572 RepID=A0A8R7QPC6_TRIUA
MDGACHLSAAALRQGAQLCVLTHQSSCVLTICSRVARGGATNSRVVPATNPGAKAKANTTNFLTGSVQDSSVDCKGSVLVGGACSGSSSPSLQGRCLWNCLLCNCNSSGSGVSKEGLGRAARKGWACRGGCRRTWWTWCGRCSPGGCRRACWSPTRSPAACGPGRLAPSSSGESHFGNGKSSLLTPSFT